MPVPLGAVHLKITLLWVITLVPCGLVEEVVTGQLSITPLVVVNRSGGL